MQLKEALFEQLRVLDIPKEFQKFYQLKGRTYKEIAKNYQDQGLDIFFLQRDDVFITIPQELVLKKLGPEGKLLNESKITRIYCDKMRSLYDISNYIKKIQSIFFGYDSKNIKTAKSEQKLLVAGKIMNKPYKKFFKENENKFILEYIDSRWPDQGSIEKEFKTKQEIEKFKIDYSHNIEKVISIKKKD